MTRALDPIAALRIFNGHGVRYVVIGGIAGNVLGSPALTFDLDICYDRRRDNYEPLVRALRELEATLRGAPAGLPFRLDAQSIEMGDCFTFDTNAGPVDCLGTPAGTRGYADLVEHASEEDLGDGLRVLIASIDDLIRRKRAAARPKDLIAVEIPTAVKEERERNS